jgi:hypothetical protein
LIEIKSRGITANLNPKEEVQLAKVFDGKGLAQLVDDSMEQGGA